MSEWDFSGMSFIGQGVYRSDNGSFMPVFVHFECKGRRPADFHERYVVMPYNWFLV